MGHWTPTGIEPMDYDDDDDDITHSIIVLKLIFYRAGVLSASE